LFLTSLWKLWKSSGGQSLSPLSGGILQKQGLYGSFEVRLCVSFAGFDTNSGRQGFPAVFFCAWRQIHAAQATDFTARSALSIT
jgi:hypothetical protein